MWPDSVQHAVIAEELAGRLRAGTIKTVEVTVHDDGDLVRVHGECEVIGGRPVPVRHHRPGSPSPGEGPFLEVFADGRVVLTASGSTGSKIGVTLLPERADVFNRVRGIFETDVLRGKSVAVLGVGSGGSFILRELAKSGVGRFLLIDHDRMEVGNVSRHECGLTDVGRLKVKAGRDLVGERNPAAEVETEALKIDSSTFHDFTRRLTAFAPDVVVCATDNRASRMLVNRHCVNVGVPAFYAGVFRRAYGGQVLRVLPSLTPCYQCFIRALPEIAGDREISSAEAASTIAYSDRDVAIEPGLSSDIVPIALLVARLVILELLSDQTSTLDSLYQDMIAPLYLWLNRREAGTGYESWSPMETGVDQPSVLRWYGIELERNPGCSVCGEKLLEGIPADVHVELHTAGEPSSASLSEAQGGV